LIATSAIATLLVVGAAIASQFRNYSVMRMVITLSTTGSRNELWLPRTAPRGLILDRHHAELLYETPIGHPGAPQPPTTRFTISPTRGGWLAGSPAPSRWRFLDIGYNRERVVSPATGTPNLKTQIKSRTIVFLPWWLLIAATGWPAPVWLVHRFRTRGPRREARGLCRRCAYDLSGIAAEQCPECGTSVRDPKVPQAADPA
jgi:hypothetical protein